MIKLETNLVDWAKVDWSKPNRVLVKELGQTYGTIRSRRRAALGSIKKELTPNQKLKYETMKRETEELHKRIKALNTDGKAVCEIAILVGRGMNYVKEVLKHGN